MARSVDDALVGFLRARQAEDRRALEQAGRAPAPVVTGAPEVPWDLGRLRRDLDAREMVVEYYARMVDVAGRPTGDWAERSLWEVRELVRLLAAVHATHPDMPSDIALDLAGNRHVEPARAHP